MTLTGLTNGCWLLIVVILMTVLMVVTVVVVVVAILVTLVVVLMVVILVVALVAVLMVVLSIDLTVVVYAGYRYVVTGAEVLLSVVVPGGRLLFVVLQSTTSTLHHDLIDKLTASLTVGPEMN